MSSTVEINTETRSGILTVPIQSVVVREKEDLEGKKGKSDDGDEELDREEELVEVVFIAMEGDTVKAVPVVTGIQDDTYIEVKEGVKEGDKVVSGPYSVLARRLEPGTEINVVKESELYN